MVGTLISCDNTMNVMLEHAEERIIRSDAITSEASSIVPLGLQLIRGDQVAICARIDEKVDAEIDWTKVRGDPIGGTKHI